MQVMTPTTPMERGGEMFTRSRTMSVFLESWSRPLSHASAAGTEFEDESEVDFDGLEHGQQSPEGTAHSDDSRPLSQTTVSSYDEAPTPTSGRGQRPLPLRLKCVEGPKGPHLFRSSQSSSEFDFDFAMQMSPMLPKQLPPRTETAFSQDTVVPVTAQDRPQFDFSIDHVVRYSPVSSHSENGGVHQWTSAEVVDWMISTNLDPLLIDCFERNDINGDVLMHLEFDDLKELGIESFGKRHQLWNALSVLQGRDGNLTPRHTPFQDVSRPCTTRPGHSQWTQDTCETPIDDTMTPIEPGGKKRRGRKQPRTLDVVTPAESVSIVAIEQLIPKPHKCGKGERCAKWRKQQRELQRLHQDHAIGRFPISPTKGGHIFVAGDPGNARTATNMAPVAQNQPDNFYRPQSEAVPSVVASSDLLGPGQLPDFLLQADTLDQVERRDPQENVKAFLNFQHMHSASPPMEDDLADAILTPVNKQFHTTLQDSSHSPTLDLFPAEHVPSFTSQSIDTPNLQPRPFTAAPHQQLRSLPKLDIPRSASAQPQSNEPLTCHTASETPRCATASPGAVYRLGTPASEADVPLTTLASGPVSRDTSQSVPPNMQYRDQQQPSAITRSHSRARGWRRPSMALEAVREHEVFSPAGAHPRPSISTQNSYSTAETGNFSVFGRSSASHRMLDPAHDEPKSQNFGYGSDCTQAGWMRKRKTKILRHEWQNAHFRLTGTQLAMHANAHYSTTAKETINVEQYSVACNTAASSSKLSAAFKGFSIKNGPSGSPEKKGKDVDPAAFAFQLVPEDKDRFFGGKTHHFAVKNKDERIDWMRELMLAKALQRKRDGYEVEVNGVQA